MVTPGHGVWMQSMFGTDLAGGTQTAPRWLKLTRTGGTITGYDSADGRDWRQVGTVSVPLPRDAEVGLFVGSAPSYQTTRTGGGVALTTELTVGRAATDSRDGDRTPTAQPARSGRTEASPPPSGRSPPGSPGRAASASPAAPSQ